MSQFVSVGNKADVSGNDLLLSWENDPNTSVIAMYLESLGDPIHFAHIARRVSRHKPILAIKSGRSAAGRRAGQSHTVAAASSEVAVDALFRGGGVLRVASLQDMLDAARVLVDEPLPAGPRVAIVGNSGAQGILAADAVAAAGLTVVELDEATQGRLRQAVATAASVQNPVDLGASVPPDQPLVMLGAGGTLAEILEDRAFRIAPLADSEADELIGSLRVARLLDGYRGAPVVPRTMVRNLLVRVAALVADLPEIAELDLNPLTCRAEGVLVVDARIRVALAPPVRDQLVRQLRSPVRPSGTR